MRRFAQKLMLLAVVFFTASPYVDCCLSGHASAATDGAAHGVDVSASTPPCHGGADGKAPETTAPTGEPGCGGCANCAEAMMHSDWFAGDLITVACEDPELLPIASERRTTLAIPATLLATGPPRASPRAATTPLSLRQRLLI